MIYSSLLKIIIGVGVKRWAGWGFINKKKHFLRSVVFDNSEDYYLSTYSIFCKFYVNKNIFSALRGVICSRKDWEC